MKIKELIKQLKELPQDYDIYIRYGDINKVSDIGTEFVCDDEGIGEYYLLCSNGQNIQDSFIDD